MIKKLVRFLLIVSAVSVLFAASVFYSRQLYVFYNRMYYGVYRKDSYDAYLQKASELLKEGRKRQFEVLIDKITVSYPHPYAAYRLEAEYYTAEGMEEKALAALLKAQEGQTIPFTEASATIRRLFRAGIYGDVIGELKQYNFSGNTEFEYYYGASLFETGEYRECLKYLDKTARAGLDTQDLFYYRAAAYYSLYVSGGKTDSTLLKQAELNAETAFMKMPEDVLSRKLLLKIYNDQKKFDAAAKISRDLIP